MDKLMKRIICLSVILLTACLGLPAGNPPDDGWRIVAERYDGDYTGVPVATAALR